MTQKNKFLQSVFCLLLLTLAGVQSIHAAGMAEEGDAASVDSVPCEKELRSVDEVPGHCANIIKELVEAPFSEPPIPNDDLVDIYSLVRGYKFFSEALPSNDGSLIFALNLIVDERYKKNQALMCIEFLCRQFFAYKSHSFNTIDEVKAAYTHALKTAQDGWLYAEAGDEFYRCLDLLAMSYDEAEWRLLYHPSNSVYYLINVLAARFGLHEVVAEGLGWKGSYLFIKRENFRQVMTTLGLSVTEGDVSEYVCPGGWSR